MGEELTATSFHDAHHFTFIRIFFHPNAIIEHEHFKRNAYINSFEIWYDIFVFFLILIEQSKIQEFINWVVKFRLKTFKHWISVVFFIFLFIFASWINLKHYSVNRSNSKSNPQSDFNESQQIKKKIIFIWLLNQKSFFLLSLSLVIASSGTDTEVCHWVFRYIVVSKVWKKYFENLIGVCHFANFIENLCTVFICIRSKSFRVPEKEKKTCSIWSIFSIYLSIALPCFFAWLVDILCARQSVKHSWNV